MPKRELDFHSGQEIIVELDRLQRNGYQRLGNWSLSQMAEHIDKTIQLTMKGGNFRMPWIIRATIGQYLVNRMIRTRRGLKGFPAPKPLVPKAPPTEGDDAAIINGLRATLREMDAFEGPLPPYPLCNRMTLENWKQMMCIHAGHHLEFLLPNP